MKWLLVVCFILLGCDDSRDEWDRSTKEEIREDVEDIERHNRRLTDDTDEIEERLQRLEETTEAMMFYLKEISNTVSSIQKTVGRIFKYLENPGENNE